jgi:3-hydroxy-9,10-secoandrosta-1,3,5(10)-triene-9,17-dione monooxygenase reductase component
MAAEEAAMNVDSKEFRRALGAFATGVTVVTARDAEGVDTGVTANSFNSVSLSPPMVLWSLSKNSSSLPAFAGTDYFAVHILAANQEQISNQFAKSGIDRFAGIPISRGQGDVPLIDGCSARFSCRTAYRYEGGDHIIIVGEVLAFDSLDTSPLVFHGGRYGLAVRKSDPVAAAVSGYGVDWLGFLLRRSYDQVFAPLRNYLREKSLDEVEYHIVTILAMGEGRSRDQMIHLIDFTGLLASLDHFAHLQEQGLLSVETRDGNDAVYLTTEGRRTAIEMMALGKSSETAAFEGLDPTEVQVLKRLLNRVICNTSGNVPPTWRKESYWLENNVWGVPTAGHAAPAA